MVARERMLVVGALVDVCMCMCGGAGGGGRARACARATGEEPIKDGH